MINILMNQKRGLNIFSKLPDDGDPWAPNNLLTPEQKKNTSWTAWLRAHNLCLGKKQEEKMYTQCFTT